MADYKHEVHEHISPQASSNDDYSRNATPATKGNKAKRHCGRFWWAYALLTVILVLVIVLPIVFVGYPHAAQSAVNESTINITAMSITNPSPSGFDLDLTSQISTNSKYHPQFDAFNSSLYVLGSDTPFLQVEIPAVKGTNGAVSRINGQKVTLANETTSSSGNGTGFAGYAAAVLKNETVTVIMKGRSGLKMDGLPHTTVDQDHTITMKGFNNLAGFNVTSLTILLKPDPTGANMLANISLPNPTVQTLELGNLTMSLALPPYQNTSTSLTRTSPISTPIGLAYLDNVRLVPGDNTLRLRGVTNQTLLLSVLSARPSYLTDSMPVDITTENATANGQIIPYFTDALRTTPLSVKLNIAQALKDAGLNGLVGSGSSTSSAAAPAGTKV